MFVRLMGIPVVVFAMPGERTDAPHLMAYRIADRIVAPWSDAVYRPDWLADVDDKTTYTGSISRHADRIDGASFERWLALWGETTAELFEPPAAAAFQEKAARIGESLQLGIRFAGGQGLTS